MIFFYEYLTFIEMIEQEVSVDRGRGLDTDVDPGLDEENGDATAVEATQGTPDKGPARPNPWCRLFFSKQRRRLYAPKKAAGTSRRACECAVSLRFLQRFLQSLGSSTMTTFEVVQQVILPATADRKCRCGGAGITHVHAAVLIPLAFKIHPRYVDLLDIVLPSEADEPDFFVSHCWSAK